MASEFGGFESGVRAEGVLRKEAEGVRRMQLVSYGRGVASFKTTLRSFSSFMKVRRFKLRNRLRIQAFMIVLPLLLFMSYRARTRENIVHRRLPAYICGSVCLSVYDSPFFSLSSPFSLSTNLSTDPLSLYQTALISPLSFFLPSPFYIFPYLPLFLPPPLPRSRNPLQTGNSKHGK